MAKEGVMARDALAEKLEGVLSRMKDLGAEYFSEDGRIRAISSISFEHRESQERMADLASCALLYKKCVAIEAPTGVGKSYAYLIPSAYFSRLASKKVVIATDTNTLLEQLETKDAAEIVKFLRQSDPELFQKGIRIVPMRGKANYICVKRMENFFSSGAKTSGVCDEDRAKLFQALREFRMRSRYGAKSEIRKGYRLISPIWSSICISDAQSCSDSACGMRQTECKYYSCLLRDAASADIILTNHSLLLSDIAIRSEEGKVIGADAWDKQIYVLPPFRNVIIDEAHNLCKNCESAFSKDFSFRDVRQKLQALSRKNENPFLRLSQVSIEDFSLDQATEAQQKAESALKCLNSFSNSFVMSVQESGGIPSGDEINLSHGFLSKDCERAAEAFAASVCDFAKSFNPHSSAANEDELFRIRVFLDDIIRQSEVVSIILGGRQLDCDPPMPYVCTALGRSSANDARLFGSDAFLDEMDFEILAVPAFAGRLLSSMLYPNMEGTILTSATLSAGDDFRFFRRNVGLEADEGVECHVMPAVFDYERNMVEIAVEGINTSLVADMSQIEKAASFIAKAINIAQGRALCLFSSYGVLERIRDFITQNKLLSKDIELLSQGRGSSSADLSHRFRENRKACLLATSSFWEGVDFPGDTLELLIIHKIPFRAPLVMSKEQDLILRKSGKSSFRDVDLPQAIIRMKQGMGRLIRSKKDRGVAVFLDSRLTDGKSSYGKRILSSLHMGNTLIASAEGALERIRSFFEER